MILKAIRCMVLRNFLSKNLNEGILMLLNSTGDLEKSILKENKLLVYFFFALAALLVLLPALSLSGKAYLSIPEFFGLSIILILIGKQRLNKYKIEDENFKSYARNIALFVEIYSPISSLFINIP
jgi:uncharacterized membrane protein YhaH (DUF805 family)